MEFTSKILKKNFSEGLQKNGNQYKRCEFEFENGQKLSTFEDKIAEANHVGETVAIVTKDAKDPRYQDLVSMTKVSGPVKGMAETVIADQIVEGINVKVASTAHTDLLREILAELKEHTSIFVEMASGGAEEDGN